MKKTVLTIALTLTVVAGMVVYLTSPGVSIDIKEIGMILGVLLVVIFALFLAFQRMRAAKAGQPPEDELSKTIMRKGASVSYYLSLYLWLALMMFEARIDLERSTLIGAGIMGMAIIFALSWVFFRYIKTNND